MLLIKGMVNCGHLTIVNKMVQEVILFWGHLLDQREILWAGCDYGKHWDAHNNFQKTILSDMQVQSSAAIKQLDCSPVLSSP